MSWRPSVALEKRSRHSSPRPLREGRRPTSEHTPQLLRNTPKGTAELMAERRARQEAEAKRQEAEAKLSEALAGKASMKYEAGTVVQLFGFKSEMQYNGQAAEIVRSIPHRGHYEI